MELRPEDATLNDHLGDALWRVKREREARFQWEQALSLKPEPEEAEKIQRKLERGLPSAAAARQSKRNKQVQRPERAKKRTEVNPVVPVRPVIAWRLRPVGAWSLAWLPAGQYETSL